MRAIILTAGQGQRLRPLTDERPKGMIEVDGKTNIERQIELFQQAGIGDVSVIKGYKPNAVITPKWVKHFSNPEYDKTNMVYSLFQAASLFDGNSEIIVSYGDIIYKYGILQELLLSDKEIAVVVDYDWKDFFSLRFENPYEDAESLVIDKDDKITSIGQVNPLPENIHAQYIGLMKFSKESAQTIKDIFFQSLKINNQLGWGRTAKKAYMTDLLQELIIRDYPVHAVGINGGWVEIDNLKDYEIAVEYCNRGII